MPSFANALAGLPTQIFSYISTLLHQILATLNLNNKSGTLLLLGLDNAGKTTLLHRLRTNTVTSFPPTDRPNTESFSAGGVQFIGMDLGGHEAVRHLWEDYVVEGVSAIVFLLDAVDFARLKEARDELDNLVTILIDAQKEESDYEEGDDPEDRRLRTGTKKGVIPLAILLNKCDLENALESRDVARSIGYDEIVRRYRNQNVGMFRISVWRGEGYHEAFRWIAEFL